MSELKPCPFCGDDWNLMVFEYDHHRWLSNTFVSRYKVVCGCGGCMDNGDFATEEEAREAWNRRANND